MAQIERPVVYEQDAITRQVIDVLTDLTRDWDLGFSGGINAHTRLVGDLACESIDLVQFVLAIEQTFVRTDFPFEKLFMKGGRYLDDLTVADVVEFLHGHLA